MKAFDRPALKILGLALLLAVPACRTTTRLKTDYPLTPVDMTDVTLSDGFWAPRQATDVAVTIAHEMRQTEETGRIRNFELAAAALRGQAGGQLATRYAFDDSDVYKLIEAAAYVLMLKPDPDLEARLDAWIAKIAAAQEPDGYLYTARTIDPANPPAMSGPARWSNLKDSHELYNVGHLYEGAVAYFKATGKRALLDVALKSAGFLVNTFGPGPGRLKLVPGHEEVEIGLVKLYRLIGRKAYLDLAKFFIDQRGNAAGHKLYGFYAQDHKPVLEQTEAVGHSVRAGYLYAGMADIAALTGDERYLDVLDRLWEDIVSKKLYLTGGIGAAGGIEGFGPAYDLPNATGYAETCATIAYALWNWRMMLARGDAKYMDLFERAAYNAFLSGSGMSGDLYFYPNPLASYGRHARSPWFGCACCPPNIARFIASMGGYAYAVAGDRVYLNLFVQGTADIAAAGGTVRLEQTTDYPWSGDIKVRVVESDAPPWTLMIRIPGWAQGKPLPSDLYVYEGGTTDPPTLMVNGEATPLEIANGYAAVTRPWAAGDTVELALPMPARRVTARPEIRDDVGRVAVERGPLVYAAEWPDNDGFASNLVLPDDSVLTPAARPDLLGGVTIVTGEGEAYRVRSRRPVAEKRTLTLIPYYAWAHRGKGEMAVWLAREPGRARPIPEPTLASGARVSASEGARGAEGVNDQFEPAHSNDQAGSPLHWWPRKGTKEWVQYDFDRTVRVSEAEVYWFDDTGEGECRLPASWALFYREGGAWKPVEDASAFGVVKDRYNTVVFRPVRTTALRIELQLPEGYSSGILEWKVR
jgi:DUF1680 family protein